jgi:hypothetical protein
VRVEAVARAYTSDSLILYFKAEGTMERTIPKVTESLELSFPFFLLLKYIVVSCGLISRKQTISEFMEKSFSFHRVWKASRTSRCSLKKALLVLWYVAFVFG